MPFFSIIVPALGRPKYTRDTVLSILLQDYDDFEVLLSNNGADPSVKAAVEDIIADPRLRYVEQPETLAMPTHWNLLMDSVIGDYVLVRPNRRVLKQGTLQQLATIIKQRDSLASLISWKVDSYDSINRTLSRDPCRDATVLTLSTIEVLNRFARGEISLTSDAEILPLALNSCASMELIRRIRQREKCVFQCINPDYRFAFSSLLSSDELVHCTDALDIAQGFEVSNGMDSYYGDAGKYFNSLGIADMWRDVPIKAELVNNSIWQDFLSALRVYDRPEILDLWDRQEYFDQCLAELSIKKSAGRLTADEIQSLEMAIHKALRRESSALQRALIQSPPRLLMRKMNTLLRLTRARLSNPTQVTSSQPSEAVPYPTVLLAAGFNTNELLAA